MSDDLIAFLRARLDEDEVLATASSGSEWADVVPEQPFLVFDVEAYCARKTQTTVGAVASVPRVEDRAHIARYDPARVLREVEAKRRIVEQWATHEALDRETFEAEGEHARSLVSLRAAYWDACRDLASVYADHPDYREEWRP